MIVHDECKSFYRIHQTQNETVVSLLWSAGGEGTPTKLVFCLLAGNSEPTMVARCVRLAANTGEGRKVFLIGDWSVRVLWGLWPPGRCLMLSSGGPLGSRLHSTRFAPQHCNNTTPQGAISLPGPPVGSLKIPLQSGATELKNSTAITLTGPPAGSLNIPLQSRATELTASSQ